MALKKTAFADAVKAAREREVVSISEIKRKALVPLNLWVLIRKVERKDKLSAEGMVLTQSQQRSSLGEVVAAAQGVPLVAGDHVLYTQFPVHLEDLEEITGDKLLDLVRYEEVFAKVVDIEQEPYVGPIPGAS